MFCIEHTYIGSFKIYKYIELQLIAEYIFYRTSNVSNPQQYFKQSSQILCDYYSRN